MLRMTTILIGTLTRPARVLYGRKQGTSLTHAGALAYKVTSTPTPFLLNPKADIAVWRPAREVTRPLPNSWEAAQAQADALPLPPLGNGNSVSVYFTRENEFHSFLRVQDTEYWEEIKHFPEFREIDMSDDSLVPLETVLALRDRPDNPPESTPEPGASNTERAQSRECSGYGNDDYNIMDSLEKALGAPKDEWTERSRQNSSDDSYRDRKDSRRHSDDSQRGEREISRRSSFKVQHGRAASPIPMSAQEITLARLGVTGAPKPPPPPPPPLPAESEHPGPPWNMEPRPASVGSNRSHHTLAGSDFNGESSNATSVHDSKGNEQRQSFSGTQASPLSSHTRKRSRDDDHHSRTPNKRREREDGGRQRDDGGKGRRPKYKDRYVSHSYG